MTTTEKDPVLVVLQLSGGNDYMNTVVPYEDGKYYDNRPNLGVSPDDALELGGGLAFNPALAPLKQMYDRGDMAVINGVGWDTSDRSHFRCMDIWHTAEPDKIAEEGWLGQAIRQIDPGTENPVTAVNIGAGLPRALVADGVSVAAVADLDSYGLLNAIEEEERRAQMLDRFAKIHSPVVGSGPVMDFLAQTGQAALKGADMLKTAPQKYSSSVEYAGTTLGQSLRDVAMIHLAGLGSRIFYTELAGFDTHAAQAVNHPKLWTQISTAVTDFWDDLREHDADQNVMMFIFSEFGRRVRENSNGTDHGAAGGAFAIGPRVNGGVYGAYPSLEPDRLKDGDLAPTQDFRAPYRTILERWMGLDPEPIINGRFESVDFIDG